MKVLLIGSGGREHALAWKLAQSPKISKLYIAPGSDAMAELGECVPISVGQTDELAQFAEKNEVDLTVVGPEAPLVDGITDAFRQKGLAVFGPDTFGAQLEGSKAFAKEVMSKAGVPTAAYKECHSAEEALGYLSTCSYPIVVKADGLAAGKGVTIALNAEEAQKAVHDAMTDQVFGEAGNKIIIEEFLEGEEVSLIAVCDGVTARLLASSQDHKRIFEGDKGPNTGGMGAYSPAPVATDEVVSFAEEEIFKPVMDYMKSKGHPFIGFLYAGVMVTAQGSKVLEFNVRFGDPEAQAVLPRMKSDLLEVITQAMQGKLDQTEITWSDGSAVTVVLASAGYPASSSKGDVISGCGSIQSDEAIVFHAGTKKEGQDWVTAGGRVLAVTANGSDIAQAVHKVYAAVDKINFEGRQIRRDIAKRALDRIKPNAEVR